MKKILLLFLTSLVILSCKPSLQMTDGQYGAKMKNLYEAIYTPSQLDSICVADKLPRDLMEWKTSTFNDFEDGSTITEYLFIKSLGPNQVIYRVEQRGENYKISKRITY